MISRKGNKPVHIGNGSLGGNQGRFADRNPVWERNLAAIRNKRNLAGDRLAVGDILAADHILHRIVHADKLRRRNLHDAVVRADDSLHGNPGGIGNSDSSGLSSPHLRRKDKLLFGQNNSGKFVFNNPAGNLTDLLLHESPPFPRISMRSIWAYAYIVIVAQRVRFVTKKRQPRRFFIGRLPKSHKKQVQTRKAREIMPVSP